MDFERGFILANTEAALLFPCREERQHCAGVENADAMTAIDALTNTVISTVPIGQAPQAVTYVRNAVPEGDGTQNLQTLGLAGRSAHIALISVGSGKQGDAANAPTTIALFDQGARAGSPGRCHRPATEDVLAAVLMLASVLGHISPPAG